MALVDLNLDTVVLHTIGSVFPGFVLLLISVTKRGDRSKHKVRPSTNNHPLNVQKLIYHRKKKSLSGLNKFKTFHHLEMIGKWSNIHRTSAIILITALRNNHAEV